MIKIEFEENVLNIPSQWSDICLMDYEQWFDYRPESKMDYVRLVADICKIDFDQLMNWPTQVFDAIVKTIQFIFDTDVAPLGKVKIDGTEYYISLGEKLTLGEWVDVESTLGSESKTKISEILAVVCRPLGESYDADRANERKEVFRLLTCDKALPLLAFFLHKKKQSEAISAHFSTVLDQAARFVKDTKTFVRDGDGIKRLPIWQRIRYIYLMKSLEKRLSKFSDFYSIE